MVKIKICGLTRREDYLVALQWGAAYVGLIFYPLSPRYISPQQAAAMCRLVPSSTSFPHQRVGVFVNESIQEVRRVYETVGLDIVQLHGDESPEYVQQLGLPCWKAIRIRDISSLQAMPDYPCDTFLLDTFKNNQYGGTGLTFPLEIAGAAMDTGKQIIVSGGISTRNIGLVLAYGRSFYAIDINSAVEERPGIKSAEKLAAFFEKLEKIN